MKIGDFWFDAEKVFEEENRRFTAMLNEPSLPRYIGGSGLSFGVDFGIVAPIEEPIGSYPIGCGRKIHQSHLSIRY